jgi:ubiquinone/menaquinone biosynthesis C-methylase UbiE
MSVLKTKNKKKYNYNDIDFGFYDEIFYKNKGVRSAWHFTKFDYIKKKINKKNIHLDIGCGSGTFISLLNNKESYGIDISSKQIKYATKKYGKKNKKFYSFTKKIPFKKNFFDSISLIELIEHLSDREIYILFKEIFRVLKPNGVIHITTPNYLSFWPLLEIILNQISKVSYEHQHINKFNLFNIIKITKRLRLQIVEKKTFILIGPFLAFFSFEISKLWINFDKFLTKIFPGFLIYIKIIKK